MDSGSSVTGYVERAYYYDYLGRVVQTAEKNHLGGISRVSTKYDLAGNILARHESHQPGAGLTADTKLTTYTYKNNNRGLIASETTSINGGTAGTVTYAYNELGQLTGKTYGNGASEALTYNIQGWLSNKSAARSGANLFNMTLRYYDATKGTSKYTGDITEWQWTQGSNPANIYSFSYDKLSRLTNSNLYVNDVAQNAFTEKNLTYDLNGNISQLQRYGSTSTLQDNFTYAYNGNTLTGITGSVSASYSYDDNGNMSSDGRKNLAINYNVLNLQQSLSQGGTAVSTYTWLSDGIKCAVVDNTTNGYDYLGSLIYSRSGSTRTFESTAFGGGRIIYSSGTYSPYYYITDHLGSTRVITNNSGTVVERNDYYPFGGKHANASYPQLTVNRQKFNGKELQTTGNTNFIDYGARMYDDVIGRWGVVDPMAEQRKWINPYNFVQNNPLTRIDYNGKEDVLIKQVRGAQKSTAESKWLVYPTGTFDKVDVSILKSMSIDDIKKKFGKPEFERKGSSLPDNPSKSDIDKTGNATIKEGKYEYEKGELSNGLPALMLNEGKGLGKISTEFTNYKNNPKGEKMAVGVAAHAGRMDWQKELISIGDSQKVKGSEGCPTTTGFSEIYKKVENKGNIIIVRN